MHYIKNPPRSIKFEGGFLLVGDEGFEPPTSSL
jgi:hypothetical protein